MARHEMSTPAGWARRAAELRRQMGAWLCRAGFHALRLASGALVDEHWEHEETCKRCGHVTRVPYSGI